MVSPIIIPGALNAGHGSKLTVMHSEEGLTFVPYLVTQISPGPVVEELTVSVFKVLLPETIPLVADDQKNDEPLPFE